jgi:tetratricopeptide (TPR) repeat protein
MSSSRIDQLQQFYQEDPTDPFNLYALALEQQKSDGHKAIELFTRLAKEHPEYIPTYYHLGRAHQELGNRDEALKTFMAGIEQARRHSDLKALRELHAAHQDLLFDIE